MIERPLIFVPGILESSLAITKDGQFISLWPAIQLDVLDDLGTNIRKNISDKSPVVATDLFPEAYDYVDPLNGEKQGIINAIIGWGYEKGKNFWTFPYDWRQSNKISGQMLTDFIEHQGLDSVDIVCHSMGGFVTRYAHKQHAPIERAVYIASPHFGNPMSYFELNPEIHNTGFSNFFEKLAIAKELRHLIGGAAEFEQKWKDLYSKWPSAYELMPDDFYLKASNNTPVIYSDGKPVYGSNETYLNNDWSLPQNMQDKVSEAMDFKKNLGEKLLESDKNILIIFANSLMTPETVGYSSIGITVGENISHHFTAPNYLPDGDTIVVTKSAMGSMSGLPAYTNSKPISNFHTVLPNDNHAIDEINKFLNP